jgi:hypothetical protein
MSHMLKKMKITKIILQVLVNQSLVTSSILSFATIPVEINIVLGRCLIAMDMIQLITISSFPTKVKIKTNYVLPMF